MAEHGLGNLAEARKFLRATRDEEMENHVHLRPEITRHIKEEDGCLLYLITVSSAQNLSLVFLIALPVTCDLPRKFQKSSVIPFSLFCKIQRLNQKSHFGDLIYRLFFRNSYLRNGVDINVCSVD